MEFRLVGRMGYSVGSCHDDRDRNIDETFFEYNENMGIEKANAIIQKLHETHSHLTDYTICANLQVIKTIWKTRFKNEEPARPAVPAQLARPAVPAHFEEKRLS